MSDGKMCCDMNVCRLVIVGAIFLLSANSPIHAQLSNDSLEYKESISSLHRIYLNEIKDNAQIYHGTEYIRNGERALGFPYFESDSMLTGSVNYLGNAYPNVNLFYNLVTDEIIIPNHLHDAQIILPFGKVDSFTVGTHFFISMSAKQFTGVPVDGFYERLSSGEPAMYARREKRLVTGTGSEENKYIQYNTYYLRKNNVFYMVDNKKTFLELLSDREDQLKKFIRSNKLKFKKDLESSLVLTTMYYSRLK
jgi:hypothetical protein